ncbi:MAG: ABC transporter permease [Bacteriovoracia bacterium]
MSGIRIILQIAFRNLFANFLNLVIGGIVLVGTLLFVVGGSFLNSVDQSMSKSIIGSVSGHVQVYSSKSKEKLALFGDFGFPDLAAIPDFSKVKNSLTTIPNVQTVIPMGVNSASITFGNTLDQVLEKLRAAVKRRMAGDHSRELADKIASLKSHVRHIAGVIQTDYQRFSVMASADAVDSDGLASLKRATSDSFWAGFDADALNQLEFLENKVASLLPDADYIFLNYMGTDLEAFKRSFDRMEIVTGNMVPERQRGIVLSQYAYEEAFKLKSARRLDKINEALTEKGQRIANEPDLQQMIKHNRSQTREIILQLDPLAMRQFVGYLQDFLKDNRTEAAPLLATFFEMNDENFAPRYKFFYEKLAPMLELYRLKPGESLIIKAFTKSGFIQTISIKVYGTFQFKGLEKSGLAGSMSLMDLMSFRDLYGYVTPEKIAETEALKKTVDSQFVKRDEAEAALFGGDSIVETGRSRQIDDRAEMGGVKYTTTGDTGAGRVYTQAEIENGVALNAAVILKDPTQLEATMKEIAAVSQRDGLDLNVVDWQEAAGNVGRFVFVAKMVLYFAVFIIFVVALVVINNAVMMATLQRIREIGTMRAIGAQRGFVLALVVLETVFLGLAFGSVGTFLGALAVKWLGWKGIPAVSDFLYFFFSGPRLFISLGTGSVIGAIIVIGLVTAISALYPAIIATRIAPVRAMQSED